MTNTTDSLQDWITKTGATSLDEVQQNFEKLLQAALAEFDTEAQRVAFLEKIVGTLDEPVAINNTIRVEVSMALDVDAEAWALEYGIDRSEVEADVEEHAVQTVVQHFRSLGVLA